MVIDILKNMFKTFSYVMTGTTISTAIFISIFNEDHSLTVNVLWQILIIAGVCALGNLFFLDHAELTKRQMNFRIMFHYLYINIVVIGGGFLCGWLNMSNLVEVIVMFIMVPIVYTIIMVVDIHYGIKTAQDLNHQLRKRFPTNEE